MGFGFTLVIVLALLATPIGVLVGVAVGAGIAHRLGKGLSPLPPLPASLTGRRKVTVVEPGADKPKRPPLPDVGA